MRELNKQEEMNICGGVSPWVIAGISAAVVFIIGVVDGYVRPLKCN